MTLRMLPPAALLLAAVMTVLPGCSSPPDRADRTAAVPEGYESWDAYWEAQDQLQRDLEETGTELRLHETPGVPR